MKAVIRCDVVSRFVYYAGRGMWSGLRADAKVYKSHADARKALVQLQASQPENATRRDAIVVSAS